MPETPEPKRPVGRPTGWTKWGEKKEPKALSLTPTAYEWCKAHLDDIEQMARQ